MAVAGMLSEPILPERPPISALFLIEFDVKAGYTIVWKQATGGVDLNGAVEYKSLPSGLHEVSEDLIYFVHDEDAGDADQCCGGIGEASGSTSAAASADADHDHESVRAYAGLSAFVNRPTSEAGERFARMIAVGVLVPRSCGRLGRAWRHADALLGLARRLAADGTEVALLEAYWRAYGMARVSGGEPGHQGEAYRPRLLEPADSPMGSPAGLVAPTTKRTIAGRLSAPSDGPLPVSPGAGHRLSPHHPAWSLTALLETFGPLVFPIYRAALLRKRILFSTHAPVRQVNHFVYNLSVLANIPISALALIDPAALPQQRIRPLFTIGVNDITFLLDDVTAAKRAGGGRYGWPGWIACTTDSILAMKDELWDVLITMPPPPEKHYGAVTQTHAVVATAAGGSKVWPTVEVAKGVPLKATQRDLRRYRELVNGLEHMAKRTNNGDGGRVASLFSGGDEAQLVDAAEPMVEPVTWAALAYNGFMWWASAGEQRRTEEADEHIHDAALLADIAGPRPRTMSSSQSAPLLGGGGDDDGYDDGPVDEHATGDEAQTPQASPPAEEERAQVELAIITYFHRLTTQLLSVLGDVVERSDSDEDDGDDDMTGLIGDGDGSYPYYYHEEDEGDGEMGVDAAARTGMATDDVDGQGGDDGLLHARRSGLVSSHRYSGSDGQGSLSSATALLLRRRGGGRSGGRGAGGDSGTAGLGGDGPGRLNTASSTRSGRRDSSTVCGREVRIRSDVLRRMGLDVWSAADRKFVCDVAEQYFGLQDVQVEGRNLEPPGV